MGAGKTAVGKRLAEKAGARFLDTDKEIEHQQNAPIHQIFAQQGEATFREIETSFVESLLDRYNGSKTPRRVLSFVLSTGGGLPLREENAILLRQLGHVIWLRTKPETVVQRIGHKLALRPIVAGYAHDLLGRVTELQQERYPIYEKVAHSVIDTDDCATPDQAACLVYDHWKRKLAISTRHYDCTD